MKFTSVCLASLALAVATASPVAHAHHEHAKRDAEANVVTVFQTVTVVGGETTTAASTTSFAPFQPSSVQQVPGSQLSAGLSQTTLSTVVGSGSTVATGSSSSSTGSQASSSSTATGAAAAAVGAKGITYSPYTTSGSCKTADEIQSDIAKLSDFEQIRVYAPDCSVIENILAAKTSSQTIFAGLYYMDNIASDISTLQSAVESNGSWDDIVTVSVGNEWVNSGDYSASQVSAAVSSARALLTDAGYSGYVVSVDTLVAVQDNTELCDYSDYIAVNSHPYWDGSVTAADAGTWLKEQISNIKSVCGGDKSVVITETGWPSQGDSYGVAVPSEANQITAVEAIVEEVGDQVYIFTMYNDYWKDAGSYGVEQYWGVFGDSAN